MGSIIIGIIFVIAIIGLAKKFWEITKEHDLERDGVDMITNIKDAFAHADDEDITD